MENLPIKTIMTVNVLWEVKFVPVYALLPLPCHDCKEWQHRRRIVRVWVLNNNARSRPWDKGRGFRSSRSLDSGEGGAGLQKTFFRPFGSRFGLKIMGGPGPWIRHWIKLRDWPCTLSAAELFIRSLNHLASLNKLGGSTRRVRWTIRKLCGWGWLKYNINIHARGEYMYHNSFHRSISKWDKHNGLVFINLLAVV